MTEDWRKALGIDYNNELDDGIQKYKGDYYLDGVFMQKIIPDEVFFVHQFLTFNKGINGYLGIGGFAFFTMESEPYLYDKKKARTFTFVNRDLTNRVE